MLNMPILQSRDCRRKLFAHVELIPGFGLQFLGISRGFEQD